MSDFSAVTLLKELAPLKDAPRVQKGQILSIVEKTKLMEIEHQIRFLNDLDTVVRLIPVESFEKPENRQKLIDAVDDAKKEKITLEEELEEEYEDDDDDEFEID
ncbi:MAG: TyeA family type III secretion system gatekeeper subunit [Pseudomonadota bacterium]